MVFAAIVIGLVTIIGTLIFIVNEQSKYQAELKKAKKRKK